ncbi:hypothetical protein [Paenibacillus sp. GCM10027629]|uniref:hypothetical protein n=1 Tax=Paenibacillus sp. GCM10027629 TaxID=3273414 RepID=UPI0036D35064
MSVIYVPQGFDSIDLGISETLCSLMKDYREVSATDMLASAFPAMHHEHMDEIRNMGVMKVDSNDMSDICFIGNALSAHRPTREPTESQEGLLCKSSIFEKIGAACIDRAMTLRPLRALSNCRRKLNFCEGVAS